MNIYFRCPACMGSQYRISAFDIRESNPHGAVCIFCKTAMLRKPSELQGARPMTAAVC